MAGGGFHVAGESDSTVWGLKRGETEQEKQVWFHSHVSLAAADAAIAKSDATLQLIEYVVFDVYM